MNKPSNSVDIFDDNSSQPKSEIEELKGKLDALEEAYANLQMEAGEWIPVKEGYPLPDYDQYVLWAYKDGTCLWDALDKDGNPWILGDVDNDDTENFVSKRATHWRKILTPMERDELFDIK